MDYDFTYDDFGHPVAQFSMGHEAFGRWLSEELGGSDTKLSSLIERVEQLERDQFGEHTQVGLELVMRLNHEGVEIEAMDATNNDELPEDTHLYEDELSAECGLQDFKRVLLDWRQFISP